ncbi:hypothetical protein FRC08_017024, partial [Ceratobasidium sp. 394]
MTSTDDDKTMSAIMAGFEHRMSEKRRLQALKRAEEEQKRRDQERGGWPGQTAEHEPVHRSHDRLLRPDVTRTRSSSVVVEGRPTFQRVRSGSIATPADVPLSNPIVDAPPFETVPRFAEKPVRAKRSRPSHGSRESFEFMSPEEDLQRSTSVEQQRASELKQSYLSQARGTLRWEETQATGDAHHEDASRPDKPRRREHERRSRELPTATGIDSHRTREETPHREPSAPNGGAAEVHLPRVKSAERVPQSVETSSGSIEEEVLKLEREQAALARRIQELRAAAEAAANANANLGPKSTQPEPDRGREREREQKPKAAEPKVKVEARKQQNSEGDVFKAMQERLRKAEEHKPGDFARKAKRAATMPVLDQDTAIASPVARPVQTGDSEPTETRVHFASDKPSAEPARPSIPRVRTPGPKIHTPTRVRTPSPRSQSPVAHGSPSSIASSNATRDTSPGHEAASSILEAVAPEPAPKPQPTPTAHSAP